MHHTNHVLWGTPHSLYTGKLRSYLINKRIAFVERMPSDPRFASQVLPHVGHFVVPVLELPDGSILQDTTEIIDALEATHQDPVMGPPGPVQRIVADILDAFGSNYLLPLAMHYRWSFREQQELFLRTEFARAIPAMPHAQRLDAAGALMDRFGGMLPSLGVVPAVIPAMEASYAELLAVLENHFQCEPYLLGGRPSIADFGLMAPLFAHLARDPVPAILMKTTAPSVFRWTERMNSPAIADGNFSHSEEFPLDDAIPATLEPVLKIVFEHWGAGLAADFAAFNRWLSGLDDPQPGTLVSHDGSRQVHPNVGRVSYPWRGVTMERASHTHSIWHFARAQNAAVALTGGAAARFAGLLERNGGLAMMRLQADRKIAREHNVLVLA